MEQLVVFIIELVVLAAGTILLIKNNKIMSKWDIVLEGIEKHKKLAGGLLTAASVIIAIGYIYNGHDWGGDFSEYISEAIALVEGSIDLEVSHMQFVLENSIPGMCPAVYPWGLPIILAVLYKIFGFNLIVFRMVGVVCLGVFIFYVYRFLCARFKAKDAVIMVLLFVCCKHYMESSTSILTDIPCAMLSMIAISALYNLIACDNNRRQYYYSCVFAVSTAAAYLLRSSGLVLILTLFAIHVVILLGRKAKWIGKCVEKTGLKRVCVPAHIIPYVVFVIAKFGIDAILPAAGNDYLGFIEGMPVTYPISNFIFYLKVLRDFFDVGDYLAIICGFVLLALIIIGMIVKFYQEAISVVFILGTMAMLYIFPYVSGIRYIFGLYPMFLMFAGYGLGWIINRLADRLKKFDAQVCLKIARYMVLCVCAFMLAFSLRQIYKLHTQPHIDSAYTPEAMEAYEFIMENTDEEDVIMFFKPRLLWLNAGRYSYNTYDDVNDLEKSDYVFFFIKDNFTNLREYVNSHTDEYELMFDNVNFQIYKHNK